MCCFFLIKKIMKYPKKRRTEGEEKSNEQRIKNKEQRTKKIDMYVYNSE